MSKKPDILIYHRKRGLCWVYYYAPDENGYIQMYPVFNDGRYTEKFSQTQLPDGPIVIQELIKKGWEIVNHGLVLGFFRLEPKDNIWGFSPADGFYLGDDCDKFKHQLESVTIAIKLLNALA